MTSTTRLFTHALAVIAALVAATLAISYLSIDLGTSRLFFASGYGFLYRNTQPWPLISNYGMYPMDALAALGGSVALAALFWKPARGYWREGLFLVLLMGISYGLLVNTYFKAHWGRPRPYQVLEFGGDKAFHEPWQKDNLPECKSFPSSHASAAFYMIAPCFIIKRRSKRKARYWLYGGLCYGVLMGISRIALGAHFVSDILWAGGITYLTALFLAAALKLDSHTFRGGVT